MRYGGFVLLACATALCSCGGGGGGGGGGARGSTPSTYAQPASPPPANNGGIWSTSRGPWNTQNSGKLNAVAIEPNESQIMFIAGGIGSADAVTTDTGLFTTRNRGGSWQFANTGLKDTTVNSLLIDGNGTLHAATEAGGIYRSTNGAQSWTQTSSASGVRQLMQNGNLLYAASQSGMLLSSDGVTWTLAFPTEAAADALGTDGTNIYVGLVDGTLVRIDQTGAQTILTKFAALGVPPIVHAIAVDPVEPTSIYVSISAMLNGIFTDALYHSSDGGATWSEVNVPVSLRGAQAIGFSLVTPHLLYVAGIGIGETSDGVTFNLSGGYGDARGLTVLPQDALVIASDQGVGTGTFATAFTPITAGLAINIVRTVAIQGNTLLTTMQDFGPAVSTNGGSTWQPVGGDADEDGVAYINSANPNLCYILDATLNVSSNACITFAQDAAGDLSGSNEPFATSPGSAKTYVVTSSGVWIASDGVHFTAANWSVPGAVDIAIDPHNANSIYVSSASGAVSVWHSSNGGQTFTQSQPLVPPGPSYAGNAPVLAVDPSNGDVLAATETALYRSTNSGATFTALAQTETFNADARVRQAAKGRRDPDADEATNDSAGFNIYERAAFVSTGSGYMFVLTTSQGLFASLDDGSTLHSIAADALSHAFEGFAQDANGNLCVGTDGEGVICASLSNLAAIANE